MESRRASGMVAASLAILLVGAACSEMSRYRVASFFFDGVPLPGSMSVTGGSQGSDAEAAQDQTEDLRFGSVSRLRTLRHFHTPYLERQCGACHNMMAGTLTKQLDEGLCLQCHASFAADETYLHGPVAVGACAECHHPHVSPLPNMLLADGNALCHRCHAPEDILPGEHHANLTAPRPPLCLDCHDPHGAADPFFLKRDGS